MYITSDIKVGEILHIDKPEVLMWLVFKYPVRRRARATAAADE